MIISCMLMKYGNAIFLHLSENNVPRKLSTIHPQLTPFWNKHTLMTAKWWACLVNVNIFYSTKFIFSICCLFYSPMRYIHLSFFLSNKLRSFSNIFFFVCGRGISLHSEIWLYILLVLDNLMTYTLVNPQLKNLSSNIRYLN